MLNSLDATVCPKGCHNQGDLTPGSSAGVPDCSALILVTANAELSGTKSNLQQLHLHSFSFCSLFFLTMVQFPRKNPLDFQGLYNYRVIEWFSLEGP